MKTAVFDLGLLGVLALALAAGCSSSGGVIPRKSGSGGSTGSGGDDSGSGGNQSGTGGSTDPGSGGASTTGSGGSMASGSGGANGCAVTTATLISDFSAAGQLGTPYTGADTGLAMPSVSASSGALVITFDTGVASTMYPYAFVGLPFSACADASAHTGVTFNINGTLGAGCTIQFSAVDKEHNLPKDGGTCMAASCYPSSKIFTLPSTPTDVTVDFTDQTGGGADPGAAVVDPAQLVAIQWQINVPAAEAGSGCAGTVTIDNVTFK